MALLKVRPRALALRGAGELGACWRRRERGQWSSLLSRFHFPWTSQSPSPPSGAHGGVLHGRPSALCPSKHPRRTPQRRELRQRPGPMAEMRLHCARQRRPCRKVSRSRQNGGARQPPSRSRSASSGTCTPRSRLAALFTEWSGRNPPRSRSLINDHEVDSAFLTRWASTSRTCQPEHQDASSHACLVQGHKSGRQTGDGAEQPLVVPQRSPRDRSFHRPDLGARRARPLASNAGPELPFAQVRLRSREVSLARCRHVSSEGSC